jgi:hypothetical protein
MPIAIYNMQNQLVGGAVIESDQLGWLYRGNERIGRLEVDWGEEDQEHVAEAFVKGECKAHLVLERYGLVSGKLTRGYEELGQVRSLGGGKFGLFRGDQQVGWMANKGDPVSGKHIILFGGTAAAALMDL